MEHILSRSADLLRLIKDLRDHGVREFVCGDLRLTLAPPVPEPKATIPADATFTPQQEWEQAIVPGFTWPEGS